MLYYSLKCRKNTCVIVKNKFLKKQEARRLLSCLDLRTPLSRMK